MKKRTWAVLFLISGVAYVAAVGQVGFKIGEFFGEKLFG